ncbi:MAG: hypothetical protein ACRDSL_03360 [Pseudonocardiaceae bacterium]
MTAIADRYRRHADVFERKVATVRPDQWSNQSPCEAWNARDVVASSRSTRSSATTWCSTDGTSPGPPDRTTRSTPKTLDSDGCQDTPYGRLAAAADPTGAQFKLVAPNAAMPARVSSD